MKKPVPPTKRPTVVKKPKEEELPPFSTEMEFLISEEVRFIPSERMAYDYVVLLAHLRDMFSKLQETHTFGKLKRFLPHEPTKDREGPYFAKLRQLVEKKS